MYSLLILATVYLAGIAASLNQFKVPPLMSVLRQELHFDLSSAGLMMSVFAIVGVFLALPSGFILRRLGQKKTILTALGALLLGSLLGGSSVNASSMLLSRIIEGTGMCLISVAAPAAIASWFPEHKRGVPMGVWSTWVPLGSIVMLLAAPALNNAGGWKSVWWGAAVYTALMFCIVAMTFRSPDAADKESDDTSWGSFASDCAVRDIWLLSLVFMLFNIMILAVCTFMPVFLEFRHQFSYEKASAVTSLFLVACLIVGPATGVIIHKFGIYKKVMIFGMIASTAALALPFLAPARAVGLVIFILGSLTATVPTVAFSSVADIMKNRSAAGTGMAILAFGQYVGMAAGPAFFGYMAEEFGWLYAVYALIPLMLAGSVAAMFIRFR